jgi:hypothetical protein
MRKIIAFAAAVELLALAALAVQAARLSGVAESRPASATQFFGLAASAASARALRG